jgi:hypothetical protein
MELSWKWRLPFPSQFTHYQSRPLHLGHRSIPIQKSLYYSQVTSERVIPSLIITLHLNSQLTSLWASHLSPSCCNLWRSNASSTRRTLTLSSNPLKYKYITSTKLIPNTSLRAVGNILARDKEQFNSSTGTHAEGATSWGSTDGATMTNQ